VIALDHLTYPIGRIDKILAFMQAFEQMPEVEDV